MNKSELKVVALVPARAGSKRLPGKNIKDFCGKPLIAWTLEAALQSSYLETVFVSTDCPTIARVAEEYGANVPFLRPAAIATDETDVSQVIEHFLANFHETFTHLLLLQPTCPLRTSSDIDAAVELLLSKNATAVYSVCEVDHSPLWSNTLPEDHSFDNFLKPVIAGIRSQDLPAFYRLNGAIYLLSLAEYQKKKSLFGHKNTFALVMERHNSIDIDTELDFRVAEFLHKD